MSAMMENTAHKSKSKSGLSTVVSTLMIVLLTIVIVGVVWATVKSILEDSIEGSENCVDIFEKVYFNEEYTCYNATSGELKFAVGVKDVALDEALISFTFEGNTKSVTIYDENKIIDNIKESGGNYLSPSSVPEKEEGKTYIYNYSGAGLSGTPDYIEIAPTISEKRCEVSDSVTQIYSC